MSDFDAQVVEKLYEIQSLARACDLVGLQELAPDLDDIERALRRFRPWRSAFSLFDLAWMLSTIAPKASDLPGLTAAQVDDLDRFRADLCDLLVRLATP